MNQLRKLLTTLTLRQKLTIVIVAAAAVAGLLGISHWHKESDFKALYTNLSPEDAAAVIQKMKESATDYRVSDNGTSILVPSSRVAEARLELASVGIPKTGRMGYELFDKTNFGATEFTEHLNYHRALEGELERSINTISELEQSRVHLTFPKESVFLDSNQPAKASVLVKVRPGARLTAQNIAAITNLVASAVEGLAPESVSVLDMNGNLLSRPRHDSSSADQPSEATLEYRQKMEADLLSKVNSTLEPLLGANKFRAGISLDCDFSSGEQSEETLDPSKSVMVSSQKTEEQGGAGLANGTPGTSSALPRPTSRPGSSAAGMTRRSENVAFQSSRVVRHTKLPQGTVKRMSISVLVDHTLHFEGEGVKAKRTLTPPTPETLKAIHDLVAGVTGFSVERGDQLVIEALPFESTINFERPTAVPPAGNVVADPRIPKWITPFIQDMKTLLIAAAAGAGVIALLVVMLLFVFSGKKSAKSSATGTPAIAGTIPGSAAEQVSLSAAVTADANAKKLGVEAAKAAIDAQLAEQAALQEAIHRKEEMEMKSALEIPFATTKKGELIVKMLRENIAKDAPATTNVLRAWLNETEARSN